ncbi:MAG: hypothetical protein K8R48_08225 [Alphaproteobacteria bacterium]|nr:hypothetical protein [Alphaproteobacteria bacterium]
MSKTKKLACVIALLSLFTPPNAYAWSLVEDRTFWGEAIDAGHAVKQVLIRHGVCKDENKDCAGGHFFTLGPRQGGFELATFGIEDQKVLEEISDAVIKVFYNTPKMTHVIIVAFVGEGVDIENAPPKRKGLIHKFDLRRGE